MQYKLVEAGNRQEALEKSGLYIGQPAQITKLFVTGDTNGQWTIHPEYDVIEEKEKEIRSATGLLKRNS